MKSPFRWDRCVDHQADNVIQFINEYFKNIDRSCLLVAGAGFDPRATIIGCELQKVLGDRMQAWLIREERPNPDRRLIEKAKNNLTVLQDMFSNMEVADIEIFAEDNAVVGGRAAVSSLSNRNFEGITDIVVDLSALSIGISFPIVRYIYELALQSSPHLNVHLMVTADPNLDGIITPISSDTVCYVHGFRGDGDLYGDMEAAKLWLPQLTQNRKGDLQRIFDIVRPDETCPILPFPATDPKAADKLAIDFISEIESTWEVDTRNIVFADEQNPLDLYRTILRIDDERKPVFANLGGSSLVLSPVGSKMLAIGALMAALERNFPVYYVEAIGYYVDWTCGEIVGKSHQMMRHVWLCGDAYSG